MKIRILLQKPFYPIALFSTRGQLKWRMTSPLPYVLFATKAAKELYYEMTKEVVQRIHSIIRARGCQLDDAGSHPAFSRVGTILLEPVCCKKQQKKSSWPVTGLRNRGPLDSEGPEWFQTDCIWVHMIPLIIQDQFHTIQNLQRSPIPPFFCCFLQQTGYKLLTYWLKYVGLIIHGCSSFYHVLILLLVWPYGLH